MKNETQKVFNEYYDRIVIRTDLLFAGLLVLEWILGIIFALWISPKTWIGDRSQIHIHVYAAIFLGGLIAAFPTFLIFLQPGRTLNRMVVAVAQILFSILFIHLTGGRIETHFHVFGSLAFLAFYRDWRTIAIATIITALDHLARGAFWPESVYGVLNASPLRALEHTGWVIFEDIFLIISIRIGTIELQTIAEKQIELQSAITQIEGQVKERTTDLEKSHQTILNQQQALVSATKMSTLGEMAGGIAHEINNPVTIIHMRAVELKDLANEDALKKETVKTCAEKIEMTSLRIAKIIKGLKSFARDSSQESFKESSIDLLIEETLDLCQERFRSHGIDLSVSKDYSTKTIFCRSTQISQVLLNLLNNAHDAVEKNNVKKVHLKVYESGPSLIIDVIDNGPGVSAEVQDKVFRPFFTTKEVGKGTGLGLSISKGIIETHGGKLCLRSSEKGAVFSIHLPLVDSSSEQADIQKDLKKA